MQSSGTLPAKDLVQYGLLAFPLACFGLPLYIHTPDFYATEFGLSLGALGVVLLLLRLFDAVQDPVIGYCLDKFSRHHAAISAVSLIALGASFLALYVPPVKPGIVWFASCVAIATTAFSVLIIQLNSLGSLWGQTLTQKTQVATVREGFGVGGLLAATILPAFLLLSMTPASAYGLYAFFFAGVLAVSGFFYIFWLRRHQQTFPVFKKIAFSLKSLRVSGELRRFYLVYAFSIFASSLPAVLVLFFIRDYLGGTIYGLIPVHLFFKRGLLDAHLEKSDFKGRACTVMARGYGRVRPCFRLGLFPWRGGHRGLWHRLRVERFFPGCGAFLPAGDSVLPD
jgi:glycoside/pentoside/hexuronide:cation symporter, GPH family